MPYRRLPNTDAARIRALKAALRKGEKLDDINTLAYSFPLKQKIDVFLTKFEIAITNSKAAREKQVENSQKFSELTKKARLYISHFIQVLNFTIARGELKPQARTFYDLDEDDSKVPSLLTEQELLTWGEKVINGEQERINNRGGNPIYSPAIALVRVNYENFKQGYEFQKRLQANSARFSAEVAQFRDEADALIVNIWNDVENTSPESKTKKKKDTCVRNTAWYMYSDGEKKNA